MPFNFGPVDSLDAVPNEFKSVYNTAAGTDGKFTVADAHKGVVTAYQGVNTALGTERGKVTALNTENAQRRTALQPWEALVTELGLTVEDGASASDAVKVHITDLTGKVKGGEAFKGNLAQIQAAAEKKIKEVTEAKDKEIAAMNSTLTEYLVDREALSELTAAKAKNGNVLLPHVKSKLKVVKDEAGKYVVRAVDETGTPRYNSAAQLMGVRDIVAEVKAMPDYAFAFESEASSGTGANPQGSKTPVNGGQKPGAGEKTSQQKISEGLTALQKGK